MFDQTANPIEASGFNLEAGHGLLHQTTAAYMNDLNVVPDLDIRTILPVFIDTGIDQFIQPLNGKNFWKFFDPDPENALYVILRWLIVETYKEGINFLQQKESIPNNIFLLMTNCTPWAFIYTFIWFLWLLMRNKKYTKKYSPHIFPSNTKAISSKLCFTGAQVHLGTALSME